MRRARFGAIHVTASAGLLVLMISACGGGSSTSANASSGRPEKTTITVAALPLVDTVGLFIAKKEGFFAQEGLTVNIGMAADVTAAISAMVHGRADVVAGGNYVSFLQGHAQGAFKISMLVDGAP